MPVVQWTAHETVTVHFIGAGPGAPDLLTLRAQRLIASCPVCLYAGALVPPEILAHAPAQARASSTPRTSRSTRSSRSCEPRTTHGHDVARLHSGDLSIYSALAEQMRRLDELAIPWDVTPGVPAFAAAAAALQARAHAPRRRADGDPHALRRAARRRCPTARSSPASPRTARRSSSTSARRRSRRSSRRSRRTTARDCPAAVVARASWPDEVVLTGTLATIAAAGRATPASSAPRRSSSAPRWPPTSPATATSTQASERAGRGYQWVT